MLLDHLGAASAQKHGVSIHSEVVLDGRHTFYLIAEADNWSLLEEFLAPFAMAGSVEVWPGSHCAAIVERGGCESLRL